MAHPASLLRCGWFILLDTRGRSASDVMCVLVSHLGICACDVRVRACVRMISPLLRTPESCQPAIVISSIERPAGTHIHVNVYACIVCIHGMCACTHLSTHAYVHIHLK